MFAGFIAQLRAAGVPASLTEYLTLLRALKEGCADYSVESFYFLARSALVKDERLIDRFDRVFAHFFRGLGSVDAEIMADLPAEWLKKLAERLLTPEEMAAREGKPDELAMSGTIRATAHNAGVLDLKMQAERRNKVKVLLLLDIGGSMDDHVATCEQLFSAARAEFKHLETFHFHNCPYERLWRTNRRRSLNETPTFEILRRYGMDSRLA